MSARLCRLHCSDSHIKIIAKIMGRRSKNETLLEMLGKILVAIFQVVPFAAMLSA